MSVKPKDTKTAILMATIDLMGRGGVEALSASALAKEVGISKATLFHHFRSVEDIPIAAFELLAEGMIGFTPPEGADLAEILAMLGTKGFAEIQAHSGFVKAYFAFSMQAMFKPVLRDKLIAQVAAAKQQMADMLDGALDDPARAYRLATITMTALDGMAMHACIFENYAEMQAAWADCAAALVKEFDDANCD